MRYQAIKNVHECILPSDRNQCEIGKATEMVNRLVAIVVIRASVERDGV